MFFLGFLAFYVLILLVWFKTEAAAEYGRLLKIRWTKAQDYYLVRSSDPSIGYRSFLAQYFDCLFVRLINCPICLSIWLGLLLSPPLVAFCGWWAPSLLVALGLFLFYRLATLVDTYAKQPS